MTLSRYMRQNLGELVLVVLATWSVATVGMNAFYLDGLYEQLGWFGRSALALCGVAVLVLSLYAAAYKRQQLATGALLYVALVVLMVSVSLMCSTGSSLYADEEGNYLYLAFVLVASATGCFLLTRTLAGSAVWLVVSSLICSVVQAFYESGEVVMSVVAVLSSLALVVHKNFKLGLERAEMANRPSPARNFVASVAPVAAVVACALALWFAVIAPLQPGVADVKLITEYRRLPIVELKGTAEEHPLFNTDMTSQNLVEGFYYTTDDLWEDPSSSVTIDANSLLEQQLQQEVTGAGTGDDSSSGGSSHDTLDQDSLDQTWDVMSWSEKFPWVILVIILCVLLVAAVIGYFVGRRVWRMRHLRRVLLLSPRAASEELYTFLLSRLGRLGFKVPVGQTLREFAAMQARNMEMIEEGTRVSFASITDTYQACVYGRVDPTEDEVAAIAAYYLGFWKAARAQLGNLKYFFKSFRL